MASLSRPQWHRPLPFQAGQSPCPLPCQAGPYYLTSPSVTTSILPIWQLFPTPLASLSPIWQFFPTLMAPFPTHHGLSFFKFIDRWSTLASIFPLFPFPSYFSSLSPSLLLKTSVKSYSSLFFTIIIIINTTLLFINHPLTSRSWNSTQSPFPYLSHHVLSYLSTLHLH